MAPYEKHVADSKRWLGESFEEVHRWLDEYMRIMGPSHRKMRHHREGIELVRSMYGDPAAIAAAIHILRDCRHIPSANHYTIGFVDALGLRKSWPTSAYVNFTEEDFEAVVKMNLSGPTGLLLWGFVDKQNIVQFLSSMTPLDPDKITKLLDQWSTASSAREALPPLEPSSIDPTQLPNYAESYIQELLKTSVFDALRAQSPGFKIGLMPVEKLICPLVCADNEYLEELRAELQGNEPLDYVRFALPIRVSSALKVVSSDPTLRTITLVTKQKTVTVSPLQIESTLGGLEVKFRIATSLSMVMVMELEGRLILRAGIHRALLLNQLGVKEIPCIYVKENWLPTPSIIAYPSFHPSVLMQVRPPLLVDLSNPTLTTEVPLHATRKMIRISADESIVPLE